MFLDTLLSECLSLSEAWLPIKVNPSLQQILTPVMTHIVIDKSTDNAKPQSMCLFLFCFVLFCFYHNNNVKENDFFRARAEKVIA